MGSSYSAPQILYICALADVCVLSVVYITYCIMYSMATNDLTDCREGCLENMKACLYGMIILAILLILIAVVLQNQ